MCHGSCTWVCVVYRSHEMSWIVGSVFQKVTSVCVLLFAMWSLRYCSIVTGGCLICFVLEFLRQMHESPKAQENAG